MADSRLSIVIVSYNTRELLRQCLSSVSASLTRAPVPYAETIVVDNASPDGSASMVAQQFPWARLIAREDNSGFAAASNEGIRRACGSNILLLNPDTLVLDDALSRLVRFLDENSWVGAVGGRLLNSDGSPQHSAFRFPTLAMILLDFFPLNHRVLDSRLNGRYPASLDQIPHAIDHPLGACFAVKKKVVEKVGLLDESFFMYCEEIDWAMRIWRAGWPIFYVPSARIVHHSAQSTGQFRGRMLVELNRSRYRLYRKHYGPLFLWAARRVVAFGYASEARRATREWRRGEMSAGELAERLETYRQVWRL